MGERSAVLAFIAKDAASGPIKQIDGALGRLGGTAGKVGGGIGKVGGAIVDVGKVAAAAAGGGILALAGGLAYATKQAADEEKGIARLDAALRANIKGYKGNTDAIEKLISKRENLAFSDDALRDSLGRLVTVTKNVEKAQQLQGIAMDFARLKGIDLVTASELIGKVSAGNLGILSRYGITLHKGATATEALAEIQKRGAGQAEAYGKTTAGAFEAFNIKLGDVVENIGGALLPVATQLAGMLTTQVIPAAEKVADQFTAWVASNQPLIKQLASFVSTTLSELTTLIFTRLVPAAAAIAEKFVAFAGSIVRDVGPSVAGLAGRLSEFWTLVAQKLIPTILDLAERVWEGGLNKAVKAAYKVISSVITVIGDLVKAITSNRDAMNVLKGIADAIGAGFGIVADFIGRSLDFLGQFGDSIRANKGAMDSLATIGTAIAGAFDLARQAIEFVIKAIGTAVSKAREAIDTIASIPGAKLLGDVAGNVGGAIGGIAGGIGDLVKPQHRAAGGSVLSGQPYLVGERGPELFVPRTSGTVVPNAGSVNVHVNVAGTAIFDPYGAAAQQIASALLPGLRRELSRQGMSLG